MTAFWTFIRLEANRQLLGWLGGGAIIVIGGLWTGYTYFYPPAKNGGSGGGTTVKAGDCSVVTSGTASGNTINCGNVPAAAKP